MAPKPVDPRPLLLGVLALMKHESVAATRTRVIKALYLADYLRARRAGGETATGWTWRVDKFGPLATDALSLLDQGVREGWLRTWAASDDYENGAVGYDAVGAVDELLRALPSDILSPLRVLLKAHGGSTNRLLRYVYGDTEPMQSVRHGDVLDFHRAVRESDPPVPDREIPAKARKRIADLMRTVAREYQETRDASAKLADGPIDDEYVRGIPQDDAPVAGEVSLTFPPPPSDQEHGSN